MGNVKGAVLRKKEDLKRIFYPNEWNIFISSVSFKSRFHFNFLLQSGMRRFEASKVEPRDVDYSRAFINVRFAKARAVKLKKATVICGSCESKVNVSKNLRFCSFCGKAIANIDKILEERQKEVKSRRREGRKVRVSRAFLQEIKRFVKENNLKPTDTLGFPTRQAMRQTMHRTLRNLGIEDWRDFSPHNIRKTHENYLLATGSNPLSMRLHMGHSIDIATAHYVATNLFRPEEIEMARTILGGLKI